MKSARSGGRRRTKSLREQRRGDVQPRRRRGPRAAAGRRSRGRAGRAVAAARQRTGTRSAPRSGAERDGQARPRERLERGGWNQARGCRRRRRARNTARTGDAARTPGRRPVGAGRVHPWVSSPRSCHPGALPRRGVLQMQKRPTPTWEPDYPGASGRQPESLTTAGEPAWTYQPALPDPWRRPSRPCHPSRPGPNPLAVVGDQIDDEVPAASRSSSFEDHLPWTTLRRGTGRSSLRWVGAPLRLFAPLCLTSMSVSVRTPRARRTAEAAEHPVDRRQRREDHRLRQVLLHACSCPPASSRRACSSSFTATTTASCRPIRTGSTSCARERHVRRRGTACSAGSVAAATQACGVVARAERRSRCPPASCPARTTRPAACVRRPATNRFALTKRTRVAPAPARRNRRRAPPRPRSAAGRRRPARAPERPASAPGSPAGRGAAAGPGAGAAAGAALLRAPAGPR